MNFVEPIRSVDKIREAYAYLRESDPTGRDATLFKVGINSNLRASDLIRLKVSDFNNLTSIKMKENKTAKTKTMYLNPSIFESVAKYISNNKLKDDDYLFFSHRKRRGSEHILREDVWRIMQKIKEIAGIDNIGSHSLRKTFGWHYYENFKNLPLLMVILNHSNEKDTLRYIGITEANVRQAYTDIGNIYAI